MAAKLSTTDSRPSRISVGIGSWADPEYTGVLFPPGVKSDERLKIYANFFNHVEVNATFYRLPGRAQVEDSVKQTPANFTFDLKLHRAFAQSPEKAAGDEQRLKILLDNTSPLVEAGKLGAFFSCRRRGLNPSGSAWSSLMGWSGEVAATHAGGGVAAQRMGRRRAARANVGLFSSPQTGLDRGRYAAGCGINDRSAVDAVTNPRLAYLRLHGRRQDWTELKSAEERHTYQYSPSELEEIAGRVRALAGQAEQVHVVANNHAADYAPKTAVALQRLLGIERGTSPRVS